jgi:hypothetical protein
MRSKAEAFAGNSASVTTIEDKVVKYTSKAIYLTS